MLVNIHTHNPLETEISPTIAGVHPADAERFDAESTRRDVESADAVGEIGLDRTIDVPMELQAEVFTRQMELAAEMRKPVVIHSVRSFEPTMDILSRHDVPDVIFHGFIGSAEQMLKAVGRGYFLSFGFTALRSPRTMMALRLIPDNCLFLETDVSRRSIVEMYAHAAAIRRTGMDHLEAVTNANYDRIFRP